MGLVARLEEVDAELFGDISPGPCVIPWAFHEHFSFFEEV